MVLLGFAASGQEGAGKRQAKPAGTGGIHLTVKVMDTDGDGVASKEEWMAVFTKLNANNDGALNEAELNAGSSAYPCAAAQPAARKKGEGK
jgi:hypothetical protein